MCPASQVPGCGHGAGGIKKAGGARTEFAVPMPAIGSNMKEA